MLKVTDSIVPGWRSLKRFGKNKAIISSYIWIVVVPIVAKVLPEINNYITSTGAIINLDLPFSWELFYYAAISFSVSSYVFTTHCPFINMKYDNPLEAKKDGYGINQLDSYFYAKISKFSSDKRDYLESSYKKISMGEDEYNDKFWIVHREFSKRHTIWRAICTFGYIIGFSFVAIILIQNFLYVWNL